MSTKRNISSLSRLFRFGNFKGGQLMDDDSQTISGRLYFHFHALLLNIKKKNRAANPNLSFLDYFFSRYTFDQGKIPVCSANILSSIRIKSIKLHLTCSLSYRPVVKESSKIDKFFSDESQLYAHFVGDYCSSNSKIPPTRRMRKNSFLSTIIIHVPPEIY